MKSDRRTLIVAAVFVCFLFISTPFRGLFLFGARLFPSHLTLQDQMFMMQSGPTDTFNTGIWSLTPPPSQSGSSRDEKLGLVLIQMNHRWNSLESQGKDPSIPLEEYCKANPDDVAAKAHFARLVLNVPSLEKLRDKQRLTNLAERTLKEAAAGAAKEPDNWYWRERQFHLLLLMGKQEDATKMWIAKPFPTTFDDHVFDEVKCKEAVYQSQFINLPRSAIYPVWGGVMFPHLNVGGPFRDLTKSSTEANQLRLAEISLGRAMIKSCPNTIAALVGIRHVRLGLWDTYPKIGNSWKDYFDSKKQKDVETLFLQTGSKADWDYCLRVAKSDIVPRFLQPDQFLAGIFVGQFGPFFIYAGIACALICVGYMFLNRTKLKNLGPEHLVWPALLIFVTIADLSFYADLLWFAIAMGLFWLIRNKLKKLTYESLGWPTLLLVITLVGSSWKDWGYFSEASLANNYLFLCMLTLALWMIIRAVRGEKGKRLMPVILIVTAVLVGCSHRTGEASSSIFLLLYLMQNGDSRLKPWPVAITLFLVGYHCGINQGLHTGMNEAPLGFFSVLVVLFLMSKRDVEPDQPRLALVTVGLGAAILGTFLIAQYDKGYTTAMESDLKQIEEVRAQYANL